MASKNHVTYKSLLGLLLVGGCLGTSTPAFSSAFALNEQNAKDLGTAYAGAASLAEDPSTGFYNPAGLDRLANEQIAISGVYVNSTTTQNATAATAALISEPMGAGSAKGKDQSVIPAFHYAKRIDENWVAALNIASPFGLKNNFKTTAFNRFMGTRAELRTIDISPSIAYGFNNGFSIGVGVDALYLQAKLDSRLGTVIPLGGPFGPLDGFSENTASNWGLGYHGGVLYEFNECNTRVGLAYRSKVKVKAQGDSTKYVAGAPGPVIIPETRQGVHADVTLPENAVLSLTHAFDDQWTVMAEAQYTRWNRFKELRLRFDDGSQIITTENFKNTMRYALGVSYQWCEPWKFRVGTAFDRTPTRDADRTTAIPDQNRTWAAIGVQYKATKSLSLDFGYAHLFFKKASINQSAPTVVNSITTLHQSFQGNSKTRADLIGMQLTWDFV